MLNEIYFSFKKYSYFFVWRTLAGLKLRILLLQPPKCWSRCSLQMLITHLASLWLLASPSYPFCEFLSQFTLYFCGEYYDKKQLWKERVQCYNLQSIIKRKQERSSRQTLEAQTAEERCLLVALACSASFLIQPSPFAQAWNCPQWAGPSYFNQQLSKCQSDGSGFPT